MCMDVPKITALEKGFNCYLVSEEVLDIKVDEFSSDAIKYHLERFDEIVSEDNLTELRGMVRDFIYKIELYPKENPKAKK